MSGTGLEPQRDLAGFRNGIDFCRLTRLIRRRSGILRAFKFKSLGVRGYSTRDPHRLTEKTCEG
jgi:hypothetical protein